MPTDIRDGTTDAARRSGRHTLMAVACMVLATAVTVGCGAPTRDIFDAHNTRNTGRYRVLDRQSQDDGTIVFHVLAQQPEHGQTIAEELVIQNYPLSLPAVRVIVDPAAGGDRQAYRWDANGLRVDNTQDAVTAPRAGTQDEGASH